MTLLHQAAQKAVEVAGIFRTFTKSSHRFHDGQPLHLVAAELLETLAALQLQEVPREPVAEAEKPFVWLPETYLTVGSGPDGWRFVFMHTDAIPPVNSIPLYRRAASPSTTRQQEVGSDTARLDWLEAWHDVAGKEHGYGDTGIALIVRVSDGFMVDSEFGGGIYDTLREAVDKAMLAAAPSTPEKAGGVSDGVGARDGGQKE